MRALDPATLLCVSGLSLPETEVHSEAFEFKTEPLIAPSGFREYDVRWRYPEEINLAGISALGRGLGTQMHHRGVKPEIAVGHDLRAYSPAVKRALMLGLMEAGIFVRDIGLALSPMAYFAQEHLGTGAVAMVTASHNPNGWTGVKMGFQMPLTHGPEEMAELRDIVLSGSGESRPGGGCTRASGVAEAYLRDLVSDFRLSRSLRVVCATGNGTAGAFVPALLEHIGAEVVPLHNRLDHSFPHYNPNPESMEMLHDMGRAVRETGADLALGFDGDGDRCGVVDDEGHEIFADKVGLLLARDLARRHPGAAFVVDVKSTGLFATDPVLRACGARTDYWKTGHSHMKRRVKELRALAGFEKSGHYFIAPPVGRGYDCGLRAAVEVCRLLNHYPGQRLSDMHRELPQSFTSPTMSPACADAQKYAVVARITSRLKAMAAGGGTLGGRLIEAVNTVNGARAELSGGGFALVRASSNTPNLVVVCESVEGEADLRALFADIDSLIRLEPEVGEYDQSL
jgi:phosphomannomutase/phosphoglucomutase